MTTDRRYVSTIGLLTLVVYGLSAVVCAVGFLVGFMVGAYEVLGGLVGAGIVWVRRKCHG